MAGKVSSFIESTKDIKGFAAPWSGKKDLPAYAYPVARTFAAAKLGFKRKRKSVMFHMVNDGIAGSKPCVVCGGTLREPALAFSRDMGNNVRVESPAGTRPDNHSTWYYIPATKSVAGGRHYICSWSMLLGEIAKMRQY